ncbi:MAG: serine/threonine-protein kinase, partial [Sulfurifustis sp.]
MRTGNTVILGQNVAARRIGPAVPAPSAKAAPDQPFEPGTRIDRYLVLDRVGGGGTGQVYRARDTELDREVALKVIGRPYCHQPEALNRLRAEAQAQARLRSPQVVTLYSLLELPFAAMLVLEYLEGETLESRLRRGGPLSPEDAIAIFDQALIGLEHVHEMGVIHRDLKPSNIYLTTSGQVKIMDFSVAKLDARDAYPPRTMVGTLLYI